MSLRSFKIRLYLEEFFGDCIPIYPLYALMFSERSGLSTAEISVLFVWWIVVALLAEIPTGIIADKFSRKNAMVYCLGLQALGFTSWLLLPNFWGYAFGFLLWGVGYAFASGAFQAYLFEELRTMGEKAQFNKVFARTQSIQYIGMLVAFIIAAIIGATNYSLALILSIAFSLIAAGFMISLPYHSKRKPGDYESERYVHTLMGAAREVKGNRAVLAVVAGLGIVGGVVGTIEEYVPLFYSHIGFATPHIPIILAAGLLITSAVGWFAHKLERMRLVTVSLMVVAGGCLFLAGMFGNMWVSLIGMMAMMRLLFLVDMLFNASLQHVIRDERRATVGSLASFGGSALAVAFTGLVGLVAAGFGDDVMYRVAALVIILAGAVLVIIGRRSKAYITPLEKDDPIIFSERIA